MDRSTILIRDATRQRLKRTARKDQTYDDLINELIDIKRYQDPLDRKIVSLQSSESVNP
jgi:predicted CopG family antitoxin